MPSAPLYCSTLRTLRTLCNLCNLCASWSSPSASSACQLLDVAEVAKLHAAVAGMEKNEKEISSEVEHLKQVQTLDASADAASKASAKPLIVVDSDQALPRKLLESSPEALRKLARRDLAGLGTAVKTVPRTPHPAPALRPAPALCRDCALCRGLWPCCVPSSCNPNPNPNPNPQLQILNTNPNLPLDISDPHGGPADRN